MRNSPSIVIAAFVALSLIACSPEEAPTEASEKSPASPANRQLTAKEASASFQERAGTELGALELWERASSAIIREPQDDPGEQITYVFPGQGGMAAVTAVLDQLSNTCTPLDDQRCWMPWEQFIDLKTGQPGAFMGSFRAENFQLALWIDQYGRNLFICYQTPAPEPEPEPVVDEEADAPVGEDSGPNAALPDPTH